MTADMLAHQAVTICQCDRGIVSVRDGGPCLPEQGSLEEVAKRYSEADIWFLEFVDVTPAMLVLLVKSPFIHEALECLRTRESGRRQCSSSQLLAMENTQKLVVLETLRGSGNWRRDAFSLSQDLACIAGTGMIYEEE